MPDAELQGAAAGESPADTAASIAPDFATTIAGRAIVIREYAVFEGLDVAHRASALIAAMHTLSGDGQLRYDRIRRLFGVHRAVTVAISAQSAGVEPEWVESLGRTDLETFLAAWFGVNAAFFVQEVIAEMREVRMRAAMAAVAAQASTGTPPLPGWLLPELEPTTSSASAPSASSLAT